MSEYIKRKLLTILYFFTGGRPMDWICFLFVDKVSGKDVNFYEDKKGRKFMSTSRWAYFRSEK